MQNIENDDKMNHDSSQNRNDPEDVCNKGHDMWLPSIYLPFLIWENRVSTHIHGYGMAPSPVAHHLNKMESILSFPRNEPS